MQPTSPPLNLAMSSEIAVDILSIETEKVLGVIEEENEDALGQEQQATKVAAESHTGEEDKLDSDHSAPQLPTRPVPLPGSFSEHKAHLFRAAINGDWETIREIASHDPIWLLMPITKDGETLLHIAVAAKQVRVVEAVIEYVPSSLTGTNKDDNTPFCIAAMSGNVEIAAMMQQENNELPNIRGINGMTPLHMAVLLGDRAMVWFLLGVTDDNKLTDKDRIEILTSSIDTDLFDVALQILKKNLNLALMRDARGETALHALARKPLKLVGSQPNIWQIVSGSFTTHGQEPKAALELTESLWNQVIQQKEEDISASVRQPWALLFVAAELGKVEFLRVLIQSYPDLIWKVDENRYTIFHIAVIHRQEEIFKLIYEIGAIKNIIATYKDISNNNMLHLASKLPPHNSLSCVSGAALQMQRELQWFQAVKQIVRSGYTEAKNKDNETPQTLFSKEHEALRKQGEDWMKKTSESCALAAALIATMVFAAAFQLPGGLNNSTGSPTLVKNTSFVFFAMSTGLSLFTSTASILMFLSILTSRYAEKDFLISLPVKLMVGLILLLISIATMVIGFTVTFFIIFQEGFRWPPITIAILASVPVTLFAQQQFPLLAEMYYSTNKSQSLILPGQQRLFQVSSSKASALNWQKPDTSLIPTSLQQQMDETKFLLEQRHWTDSDITGRRITQRE